MKIDFEICKTNNGWLADIDGETTEFLHSADRFLDSLLGENPCTVPVTLIPAGGEWPDPDIKSGFIVDFWYRGMLSGNYLAYETRTLQRPMTFNGCLLELCEMITEFVPKGHDFRIVFPEHMVILQRNTNKW